MDMLICDAGGNSLFYTIVRKAHEVFVGWIAQIL